MSGLGDCRRTSINNLVLHHLVSSGSSLLFVNPIRLEPVVMWDQTEVNRGIRQHRDPPALHITNTHRQQPDIKDARKVNTHDLNSSENSSSFRNTYGYPYLLLNLSSICFMLNTIPSMSPFLASDTIAAFAFRSGGAGLSSFTVS